MPKNTANNEVLRKPEWVKLKKQEKNNHGDMCQYAKVVYADGVGTDGKAYKKIAHRKLDDRTLDEIVEDYDRDIEASQAGKDEVMALI